MSTLHFDSLEIKNFRCFEHLTIEKLGRMNLIVGKNSVGKTCLLEALRLYAYRGHPSVIRDILLSREESSYASLFVDNDGIDAGIAKLGLKYLFHNRTLEIGSANPISIGNINSPENTLNINIDYYIEEDQGKKLTFIGPAPSDDHSSPTNLTPRVTVKFASKYLSIPLPIIMTGQGIFLTPPFTPAVCHIIPATGLISHIILKLWPQISLTDAEKDIISALKTMDESIEAISIIGGGGQPFNPQLGAAPLVIVKPRNRNPIPLRSLGEGLIRAFGISLALVNSRDGFLLIDEFESGLHHSVQTEIWRLIFKTAKRLNVQVFTTTHSWDCVKAFQEAATEDQNEEAMLIRLQKRRSGEGIEAVLYDERRLAIATEEDIEVR
jgi:hypothetical protein